MVNAIDLARVDLNLLVLFDAVLRERHVGRAAARLHLTSSAVSHGLNRLRRQLDDPLFVKHPRGVTPTQRALDLAVPIAALLDGARAVYASAGGFDPARARRQFVVGAPDGLAAALPALVSTLARAAPGIDVAVRHVLPMDAIGMLDAGAVDVMLTDVAAVPPRFAARTLPDDRFVVAVRAGHPFLARPTLDAYCQLAHAIVSQTGELTGFVDAWLARRKRSRRVVLALPDPMLVLVTLASSDVAALVPARLLQAHGARFGLASAEFPGALPPIRMRVLVPSQALGDRGIAWLVETLASASVVPDGAARASGEPDSPARGRGTGSSAPRRGRRRSSHR